MTQFKSSYDRAKAFFLNNQNVQVTQGSLVMLSKLTTQADIAFSVKENVPNGTQPFYPTEVRIKQNDAFIVTDVLVALKLIANAIPTDLELATAMPHYFPNKKVFTGANNQNVAAIYNSRFELMIDSTQFSSILDVNKFLRIPTSQEGTTTSSLAGAPPVTYDIGSSEKTGALYGFYPMFPYIGFTGLQNVQPQIVLPTSVPFEDANISVFAQLVFNGWHCANGAKDFIVEYRDSI